MPERGRYIVIEGNDGTGKSTQVARLQARLQKNGTETIHIEEPGSDGENGLPIANAIRVVIKNGSLKRDGTTNLLLFTAARHELWTQHMLPALMDGKWVISARNYFSTIAYQGYGEGLDVDIITETTKQFVSPEYMRPDLAVILTLEDEDERAKRISGRGELTDPDTFESKDSLFQQRVNDGYLKIAQQFDLPTISALQSVEKIAEEVYEQLEKKLMSE